MVNSLTNYLFLKSGIARISSSNQLLYLPESIFYQAIYHFRLSWATSASALLDSALIYGQSATPRLAEHLSVLRLFSRIANSGWLACEALELFQILQRKKIVPFTNSISQASWVKNLGLVARLIFEKAPILVLGAGASAFSFVGSKFYKAFFPSISTEKLYAPIPAEERKWITLSLSSQHSQAFGSLVYFARIVANLAIACFFPERRLWCVLNIAMLSYSFLKAIQLKWLNFSRSFEFPGDAYVNKVIITYSLPLLPNVSQGNECGICLQDSPTYFFSPQSPMHLNCLIQHIYIHSKKFLDHWDWSTFSVTEKMKGVVTRITYHAKITLSQADLPRCPTTRVHPLSHDVTAQFWSPGKGEFKTTVNLTLDPKASTERPLISETFLTRLGTVYTAFTAGLTIMQQRHPELLEKIFFGQKILSLVDLGVLIRNYHQLYRIFYQRYVSLNVQKRTPQDRVTHAQARLESARLQHSRLQTAMDEAIRNRRIIQGFACLPQSEEAERLLQERDDIDEALFQAKENGEIIYPDLIPQSEEAKQLLQQFVETKTVISSDEGVIESIGEPNISATPTLEEMEVSHQQYAQLKLAMDEAIAAKQFIVPDPISQTENAAKLLRRSSEINAAIRTALENGQIVEEDNYPLPQSEEARALIGQHTLSMTEFSDAIDEHESALTEQISICTSLEKKYHRHLLISMGVGVVGLSAISALVASLLTKQWKPTCDLTALSQKTKFRNTKIGWKVPWMQYGSQSIFVSRIVMDLALAYFSPDRFSHLFSAFFQIVTLWNSAKLLGSKPCLE